MQSPVCHGREMGKLRYVRDRLRRVHTGRPLHTPPISLLFGEREKLLTLYVFKLLLIRQHYRKQTNFQWHEIKLPKIITILTVK
jgi:hypothetical protein